MGFPNMQTTISNMVNIRNSDSSQFIAVVLLIQPSRYLLRCCFFLPPKWVLDGHFRAELTKCCAATVNYVHILHNNIIIGGLDKQ